MNLRELASGNRPFYSPCCKYRPYRPVRSARPSRFRAFRTSSPPAPLFEAHEKGGQSSARLTGGVPLIKKEPAQAGSPVCRNYLCFEKQSLQYTGRPSVGWNGTLQGFPQEAQTASNISRCELLEFLRASRHDLHLCGSFVNPFSSKKSCSLAVNTNSWPQSLQIKVLSW